MINTSLMDCKVSNPVTTSGPSLPAICEALENAMRTWALGIRQIMGEAVRLGGALLCIRLLAVSILWAGQKSSFG